jgi:WD40 repeat protein
VAVSDPSTTPYGGHNGRVFSVAYAPDGATLATGGGDGTVQIWDISIGQRQPPAPHTVGRSLAHCGSAAADSRMTLSLRLMTVLHDGVSFAALTRLTFSG